MGGDKCGLRRVTGLSPNLAGMGGPSRAAKAVGSNLVIGGCCVIINKGVCTDGDSVKRHLSMSSTCSLVVPWK